MSFQWKGLEGGKRQHKSEAGTRTSSLRAFKSGLFFQHLSGILSIWICRNLELFWFLLSYFGQNHWVILQKMLESSHFTKNSQCFELLSQQFTRNMPANWVISQKGLSYFRNLELFWLKKPLRYFWNVEKISLTYL